MALLLGVDFSAILGTVGTIAVMPLAAFAGALGWVGLAALLTAESPAGAGTTMTLHGSLFNLGAAGGGAIGGLLLALGDYGSLAVGLPVFGIASALLASARLDRLPDRRRNSAGNAGPGPLHSVRAPVSVR